MTARPNLPTPIEPLEQAPTAAEAPWIDPYDVSYRRDWIFLAILLLATAAAFLPALRADFIWRDDEVVLANDALRSARTLTFAWLHPRAAAVYRPVADAFFFPQHALWRAWNPSGYHTVSLALHLINTWLIWLLLRRLHFGSAIPLAAAMFFALHPIAAQPVSWIAQQPVLLATTFAVLSLLEFLRLTEIDPPPPEMEDAWNLSHRKWLMMSATLAPLLAALLSDAPTACGLPIVMAALLWWKRPYHDRPPRSAIMLPLAASIAITAICTWVQWSQSPTPIAPLRRLLTAAAAPWVHLINVFYPIHLAITYRGWESPSLLSLGILCAVAIVAAAVWIRFFRRRRPMVAAMIIFLALLLPPIALQSPSPAGWLADHQQYLARIAPLTLIAVLLLRLIPRGTEEGRRRLLRPAALAAIAVVLMALAWRTSETYANNIFLWTHALKHHPESTLARTQLGQVLLAGDNLDDAAEQFRRLLERDPSNIEARLHLADVYQRQNKSAESSEQLRRAAELNPRDASIHRRLAAAAARTGDDDTARRHYELALQIDPRDDMSMNNLATIYARRGEMDRAMAEYRRAIAANPHSTKSHINLANLLFAAGKLDEASEHLRRAVEIDPNDFDAYMSAGAMLMNFKDFHNASRMFRQAIHLRRESPEAFNALGVSLAAQGMFDEAIYNFGRALDLNPNFDNARENLATARAQRDGTPATTRSTS